MLGLLFSGIARGDRRILEVSVVESINSLQERIRRANGKETKR
jgi:hypothetical protein